MSRSGPRGELCEWLFCGTQLSRCPIKTVDHHFVDTEIRNERMSFRHDRESHNARVVLFVVP